MEVTEVRIKLMHDASERLLAFCSITLDACFVIRDLKIIDGPSGEFVAMPSRKLSAHCPQCRAKNHLRACFCNQCGLRLNPDRVPRSDDGRARLYADIAHPINSTCRESMQRRIIEAYRLELERSKQAGYVSNYDDLDEDLVAVPHGERGSIRTTRSGETAKVEPAEQFPRGPHVPAAAPRPEAPTHSDSSIAGQVHPPAGG